MNEDEMRQLSPDPMALSAQALAAGTSLLVVTVGARGAVYVAAPGFGPGGAAPDSSRPGGRGPALQAATGTIRTARVDGHPAEVLDPTGCGDVFGAVLFSRLLAGERLEEAMATANGMAARAAGYRGARGLARHLKGELLKV
jgi:sugar/nucleoside kinase (ribokinase family)